MAGVSWSDKDPGAFWTNKVTHLAKIWNTLNAGRVLEQTGNFQVLVGDEGLKCIQGFPPPFLPALK